MCRPKSARADYHRARSMIHRQQLRQQIKVLATLLGVNNRDGARTTQEHVLTQTILYINDYISLKTFLDSCHECECD